MSKVFFAFDAMDAPGVRQNLPAFEALAAANENITIDMSKVVRIDGSGVGAVAHVKRSLNAKGLDVNVVNVSGPAAAIFADLGLRDVLGLR